MTVVALTMPFPGMDRSSSPGTLGLNPVRIILWFLTFLVCPAVSFAHSDSLPRLPATNLLVYRASDKVLPVNSTNDWLLRRSAIVAGMERIMGKFPDRSRTCPLDVQTLSEEAADSYSIRLITYVSEPGSRVPAYLLVPKSAVDGKALHPAVLVLHPTDMEYGHRVAVKPLRSNYRAYAADLAARGFVVLAPAYPLMADYQPDLKALGYQSGTMKAIWDNCRGLDVLETVPSVRKGSYGVLGHSLGGHNAIYTAVFEPRIKVVVSSCGFDSFRHYMNGDIKGWTSERYMPALLDYQHRLDAIPFDFHELAGALAPRPFFINAPLGDSNFKSQSVDEIVAAAGPVYRLFGAEARLVVEHPDCGHDFPADVRERAYKFLEQSLVSSVSLPR
jgi:dienelactone hydrolase